MVRKTKISIGVLGAAALIGFSALNLNQSASAASTASSTAPRIFVVTTGSQSNEDAIANRAAVDSSYRAEAIKLANDWASRLNQGTGVNGLTGTTAQQKKAVQTLSGELDAKKPASGDGTATSAGTDAVAVTKTAVVPLVNGSNPNSFAVRGEAGSGNSYWTGMTLIVAARYCDPDGCDSDTDRYTSKVTVNPGAVTSRVNAVNLYSPDSGNFGNKHFELWAITNSSIVGNADTGNLPASSEDYVTSTRALNGQKLTIAVTLWVYLNPYAEYTADGAKTSNCTGAKAPDNACVY